MLIAAQSLALHHTLVTDNEREFSRIAKSDDRKLASVNWPRQAHSFDSSMPSTMRVLFCAIDIRAILSDIVQIGVASPNHYWNRVFDIIKASAVDGQTESVHC